MKVRLHAFEPVSRANGPGRRAVVWFQGCTIGCLSCFNPSTHAPDAGHDADTADIVAQIVASCPPVEGVSISGGEPFQQPEALLDLVQRVRAAGLSILIFSGYARAAIVAQPLGPAILSCIDVLVAGPYIAARHLGRTLLGSANQQIELLTPRYQSADFEHVPRAELILHADGTVTATGIRPLGLHQG